MVKLIQIIPQQLMNCLLAVMVEHRKVLHLAEDSQAMVGLLQISHRLVMNLKLKLAMLELRKDHFKLVKDRLFHQMSYQMWED